ncbi:hypothetical protein I6F20_32685 [Bradyrhizobium sp. IC3123]|uniref:glycine-rich domain-containing protein n=1 Tax=Bradyrhizobium sp. IC3123 TaxID=2793803 RepID=UPI0023DF96CA|nr:hypothetical protein [Bradyrhizobium sp. IC3123]MCA1393776.1 hypothetical protein [Bradyrhizobium sp. IC3123]
MRNRYDETWHRLIEWTKGQAPSERLAAQILIHEGFSSLDPSHPLGGPDGGKDAVATKGGVLFAMAVYFPRGAQRFSDILSKFEGDLAGAQRTGAKGIAFVTNQELRLGEREQLRAVAGETLLDLFHLERVTTILDTPAMGGVREQFLDMEPEGAHVHHLGGLGGSAPGAGGGGGGAIGGNASGGHGGPGGDMILLDGSPGKAPGAGGGGAGTIGEDAIGGEGGGGGEYVKATFGPEELAGVHHLQFHVGEGGKGGPGEDTIVNLCAEDGTVLRQIKAKGGKVGAPPYCPPPRRVPNQSDLDAGLRVTSMLAAEFIRVRDGLWTIVEGGWDWIQVTTVPFRQLLPIYVEIDTGTISPAGSNLELTLVILRPDGFLVTQQSQIITVEGGLIKRSRFVAGLELVGSQGGVWHVQVRAGLNVIADFPIEIRLPTQNS